MKRETLWHSNAARDSSKATLPRPDRLLLAAVFSVLASILPGASAGAQGLRSTISAVSIRAFKAPAEGAVSGPVVRDVVVRIPFPADSLPVDVRMNGNSHRAFHRDLGGRLVELGPSWTPIASRETLTVRLVGNDSVPASGLRLQFRPRSISGVAPREGVVVP